MVCIQVYVGEDKLEVPYRSDRVEPPFSLLMSFYAGDDPQHLHAALESVASSTVLPDQLVMVQDGEVPDALKQTLQTFQGVLAIDHVVLAKNVGLGPALQSGLEVCRHALVARFDSDDILSRDRFAVQLSHFLEHPNTAVVGGWITEFDSDPDAPTGIRQVPSSEKAIYDFAKLRNPMNHMTVMFRKQSVIAAGGYRDEPGFEDYSLWARMLVRKDVLINIPSVFVHARAGRALLTRRGGWRYVRLELKLQTLLYKLKLIGATGFIRNCLLRIPPRLMPNAIRSYIYSRAARKSIGIK